MLSGMIEWLATGVAILMITAVVTYIHVESERNRRQNEQSLMWFNWENDTDDSWYGK